MPEYYKPKELAKEPKEETPEVPTLEVKEVVKNLNLKEDEVIKYDTLDTQGKLVFNVNRILEVLQNLEDPKDADLIVYRINKNLILNACDLNNVHYLVGLLDDLKLFLLQTYGEDKEDVED